MRNMRAIAGPFFPDQNVSVLITSFDDLLWIVLRRALHDATDDVQYGILEFRDVRMFRSRFRVLGVLPDVDDIPPAGWWAVEIDKSDFLKDAIDNDPQRSARALSSHKHFVVPDGSNRAIDIIARDVSARATRDRLTLDLQSLIEGDDAGVLGGT